MTEKDKKPKKRKYTPPALTEAGNLLSLPQEIWVVGAAPCCLAQRLQRARRGAAERSRLASDLVRMLA